MKAEEIGRKMESRGIGEKVGENDRRQELGGETGREMKGEKGRDEYGKQEVGVEWRHEN